MSGGILIIQMHGKDITFDVPARSGEPLAFVRGANWDYQRNDVRHYHYFIFEHDTYVFNGRYIYPLGAKEP